MKNSLSVIALVFVLAANMQAQDYPLVTEKKGTFKILSRTNYASNLTFTQAEMAANLKEIEKLVVLLQANPVLAALQGFNGQINLDDVSSVVKCGYGVPVNVEVEFCAFFKNKNGDVVYNTIEPPEWELQVNCMNGMGFNSDYFDMNKCYFTVPFNKKTIAPGIDLYDDEAYVLYDPSRPNYWIPVTVNEAFACARAFAAKETDEFTARINKQMLDQEWAEIPASSYDKQAYFGGNLSRVSATSGYGGEKNLFPPIMTVNPEYWNKSRPKSDIQFMVFKIRDKRTISEAAEECLKHQCTGYQCILFEQAMDTDFVKSLLPIVTR